MAIDTSTLEPQPIPEQTGPPIRKIGWRAWMRQNLFSGPVNSAVTIVASLAIVVLVFRAIRFLFVTARWEIVRVNLTSMMVGDFPRDELWRPWVAVYVVAAVIGLRWGAGVRARRAVGDPTAGSAASLLQRVWPLILFGVVIMAFSTSPVTIGLMVGVGAVAVLARAVGLGLPRGRRRWLPAVMVLGLVVAFEIIVGFGGVPFPAWRGLLLTLFLAIGGIVLSFPIGVLLALGRRSTFPAIRAVCVAYIELIRGVPLITLLFMAFLVIAFFLPPGTDTPSLVTRALVAFVLFTAAYVAEVVRGGLQSIPRGQIEAAQALGLTPIRITTFIVLPQALRAVIPAMVGQFISLFKDTSLAGSIGLAELLRIAEQVNRQPAFFGQALQAETLAFAAFIYWVGAYWMSKTSQRLEKRLGVGER